MFSEENVWKLCDYIRQHSSDELQHTFVVFISNERRQVSERFLDNFLQRVWFHPGTMEHLLNTRLDDTTFSVHTAILLRLGLAYTCCRPTCLWRH